ncbi:hypothetical protein R3I94_002832 [Phoxinus phoxinus]|uniref:Uncharacterized protein n=1 Tax=Phoxinus phoxinus TaxID=58324 RepID=A0AAN9DGG5_9TELE
MPLRSSSHLPSESSQIRPSKSV